MNIKPERIKDILFAKLHLRIGAFILIIILMFMDFSAIEVIFNPEDSDIRTFNRYLFSMMFAICLEGIPTFMGFSLSKWLDSTQVKKNDSRNAMLGLIASCLGLIVAFVLLIFLRRQTLITNGGATAFKEGTYPNYPIDVFLMVSPILTSILAFLASWFAFQTETSRTLESELNLVRDKFLATYHDFLTDLNALQDARIQLWTSLTSFKGQPKTMKGFRILVLQRIKSKLMQDCIDYYPIQMRRYNTEVEAMLKSCIEEMSKKSTIPETIKKISLEEIIEGYDENRVENEVCWDYEKAKSTLEESFARRIDNAVVVAQSRFHNNDSVEGENRS